MKDRIQNGVIDHTGTRMRRLSATEQHLAHSTDLWVFLEQLLYLHHLQRTQDFRPTRIACYMVQDVGLRDVIGVSIFAGRFDVRHL